MEDKDHLEEILGRVDQINDPIDLEMGLMQMIQERKSREDQISRFKLNGFKALCVSVVFLVILGVLFSLPNNVQSQKYAVINYAWVCLLLLVLFVQMEMGGKRFLLNLRSHS